MVNNSIWLMLPLTGALIGWLTNFIAIKLLFVPKKKTFGIQGLIPRRKEKISEKIAEAGLKFLPNKIEKLTKFPLIGKQITNYIQKEIAKKVHSMNDEEIQEIIEKVAKKELVFIQISGAILGAIVGFTQAAIIYFGFA